MGRDPGPGGRGGGQAGSGGHASGLMVLAVFVLGITIVAAGAQTWLLHEAAAGHASCCDSRIWRFGFG